MNAFLLGAYACGAVLLFVIGLFLRDAEPWPDAEHQARVPLWEIVLFAAAWPVAVVWAVLELRKDAGR